MGMKEYNHTGIVILVSEEIKKTETYIVTETKNLDSNGKEYKSHMKFSPETGEKLTKTKVEVEKTRDYYFNYSDFLFEKGESGEIPSGEDAYYYSEELGCWVDNQGMGKYSFENQVIDLEKTIELKKEFEIEHSIFITELKKHYKTVTVELVTYEYYS